MKTLRRRIDKRVIPFLLLAYLMNYLDKILLNYAKVMGLTKDLKLIGNDYTNASSAFWIAVLFAEFPNIYFLQRLPVGKWLAFCLFGWSCATACTAACTDYSGLVAARVFCGLFEAGIPPSLMLISSQWYTKKEQIVRFVWWYMGTAGGLVLGGFLSWCFQQIDSAAPIANWKIMYIVLGLVTFVLSILVALLIPDTPMEAGFLSDQEKISLLEHVKTNQTGIGNRRSFSMAQLKEAFMDFQLWCQWLIMLLEGGGGGVITTYSATLIVDFGYNSKQSALLSMGGGAVSITVCLLTSYGARYFGHRWFFLILITIPSLTGAALMAYLPKSDKTSLLAGIYLVDAIFAAVPIQFSWVTANVAGHTKKACAMSLLNAAFAIGNIIGPQTFQAQDAPDYTQAKAAVMCFQSVIVVLAIVLLLYFKTVNKKRDQKSSAAGEDITDIQAFAGLTDKQNPHFRYVY
ncbi:hypothetical protein M406DRAFT_65639 [Cryphonectria parasitica EP155]|uniref:Major facilitator superfamily (MFS) profile domain-containing protein n=1 Tax=Cryphonectria parasitica (strain ATCC 38755 / EP155) TaxID=660469 RepID=A0A9P4YAL9_CRYP1|nr:uncharacterized protein M406DRAFT_65639 [Cryphonectria parasitica EP155]KAF3769362.1 hypothetical protein M406DRAFT_65639 [Cryphonectria parasitica EP155]